MTAAAILREWFGVSPSASRLVAALFAADGEAVRHEDLLDACGQTRNGMNLSIKFLRAAMASGSITNVFGVGFRLTTAGLADCRRGLEDASQRRAA